ncbi:uncharacterized protein LOC130644769 [Hydractinia symbiolongicarpus]|uniref:uncharacterized protein LOC130644769 n=1 Tax=Hydractinia symbiolongicarpus TaxID=13093 RepID=UPI00254EA7E0|nr:uncharacterized protein LOC130644769 [Hydractinia symbiolongicarpus]
MQEIVFPKSRLSKIKSGKTIDYFWQYQTFSNHICDVDTEMEEDIEESDDIFNVYEFDCYDPWVKERKDNCKGFKKKSPKHNTNKKIRHKLMEKTKAVDEDNPEGRLKLQKICPISLKGRPLKTTHTKRELKKAVFLHEHFIKQKKNILKRLDKNGIRRLSTYSVSGYSAEFIRDYGRPKNKTKFALSSVKSTTLTLHNKKLQLLVDLQYREVMPEDYELLLLLDNTVLPNVASNKTMNQLETTEAREKVLGDLCVICVEDILKGQQVIVLPKCEHIFHADCITIWLTTASDRCPIDSLKV